MKDNTGSDRGGPEVTVTFDLDFRPHDYVDFGDPVSAAVNGIKGVKRREMVRDMLEADGERRVDYDRLLGPIDEAVLAESVPEARLDAVHRVLGPSWLGGEFLPDLESSEVEIARIVLASTTGDVFSIRARWTCEGYHYTIRDEYPERGFTYIPRPQTSTGPLSMGEFIRLIDSAEINTELDEPYSLLERHWWSALEWGLELQACVDFAWVESEIYPELRAYYRERGRLWRLEREAELFVRCPRCDDLLVPDDVCDCPEEAA